jgi:hypothetical protein
LLVGSSANVVPQFEMPMNNEIWVNEVRRLLQKNSGDSGMQCVAGWESLLARTELGATEGVSDWHIEQTLGFLSHCLREVGQIEAACALEERIGEVAEARIQYGHVVAGTALARASLIRFELGEDEKAVMNAEQALAHLGISADPSPVFETLINRLREYRMANKTAP